MDYIVTYTFLLITTAFESKSSKRFRKHKATTCVQKYFMKT